jgi:hypothetical protein
MRDISSGWDFGSRQLIEESLEQGLAGLEKGRLPPPLLDCELAGPTPVLATWSLLAESLSEPLPKEAELELLGALARILDDRLSD